MYPAIGTTPHVLRRAVTETATTLRGMEIVWVFHRNLGDELEVMGMHVENGLHKSFRGFVGMVLVGVFTVDNGQLPDFEDALADTSVFLLDQIRNPFPATLLKAKSLLRLNHSFELRTLVYKTLCPLFMIAPEVNPSGIRTHPFQWGQNLLVEALVVIQKALALKCPQVVLLPFPVVNAFHFQGISAKDKNVWLEPLNELERHLDRLFVFVGEMNVRQNNAFFHLNSSSFPSSSMILSPTILARDSWASSSLASSSFLLTSNLPISSS